MRISIKKQYLFAVLLSFIFSGITTPAFSDINYVPFNGQTNALILAGRFDSTDKIADFITAVNTHKPRYISFNSPGGNVIKALEFGRAIRALGLDTIQIRSFDCASACAYAFLGGVNRFAETGSIGLHKASFSENLAIDSATAVSVVQEITSMTMTYIIAMGAKPELLTIALEHDSSDMRYLTNKEMEEFRVITVKAPASPAQQHVTAPSPIPPPQEQETKVDITAAYVPPSRNTPLIPVAQSGYIQHPKGHTPLKSDADTNASDVSVLRNGQAVSILSSEERWYKVKAGQHTGYLHHTWVHVMQFDGIPFGQMAIQIKSFRSIDESTAYAQSLPYKSNIFLGNNGWYAITLNGHYPREQATSMIRRFKQQNIIPSDSMITSGNTYARKICCNN